MSADHFHTATAALRQLEGERKEWIRTAERQALAIDRMNNTAQERENQVVSLTADVFDMTEERDTARNGLASYKEAYDLLNRKLKDAEAVADAFKGNMEAMQSNYHAEYNRRVKLEKELEQQTVTIRHCSEKLKEFQLPGWNGTITREEAQIIIDMRNGRVICHALPASLEEAVTEAAALIAEAKHRCGKPPTGPDYIRPVRRWGESDADFSNRVATFEAKEKTAYSHADHKKPPVADMATEQQTNEKDFRNPIYEMPPIWNPATETKEALANRRHAYDDRQARLKQSMPVAPRVERKIEADLNQALEPYRDSDPGEHQCVIDALNEC